jgi:hypothetical protein
MSLYKNYELLTHFFQPPGARSSNVDDAIMEKVVEAIRESDEKTLRNILDSNADIDLDDQYVRNMKLNAIIFKFYLLFYTLIVLFKHLDAHIVE